MANLFSSAFTEGIGKIDGIDGKVFVFVLEEKSSSSSSLSNNFVLNPKNRCHWCEATQYSQIRVAVVPANVVLEIP